MRLPLLVYLVLSQSISGYQWFSRIIPHYFLSWAIFGYIWLSLIMLSYLKLSWAISIIQAISGCLRLSFALSDDLYQVSNIRVQVEAGDIVINLTSRKTQTKSQREQIFESLNPGKLGNYLFFIFLDNLLPPIEVYKQKAINISSLTIKVHPHILTLQYRLSH